MIITHTHTYIDPGNHPGEWLIGQLRRLADEFGRPGIRAKRGQTNTVFFRQGGLRLRWPNRKLAVKYKAAADKLWGAFSMTEIE